MPETQKGQITNPERLEGGVEKIVEEVKYALEFARSRVQDGTYSDDNFDDFTSFFHHEISSRVNEFFRNVPINEDENNIRTLKSIINEHSHFDLDTFDIENRDKICAHARELIDEYSFLLQSLSQINRFITTNDLSTGKENEKVDLAYVIISVFNSCNGSELSQIISNRLTKLFEENQDKILDEVFSPDSGGTQKSNFIVCQIFSNPLLFSDVFIEKLKKRVLLEIDRCQETAINLFVGEVANLPIKDNDYKKIEEYPLESQYDSLLKESLWREKLTQPPLYEYLKVMARKIYIKSSEQNNESDKLDLTEEEEVNNVDRLIEGWLDTTPMLRPYEDQEGNELNPVKLTKNFILRDIERVFDIEKAYPGSSAILQSEFGIQSFGRYPTSLLKHQYEHREDSSMRYGVVMNPRTDHNGALYQNSEIFSSMVEFLSKENNWGGVRVVEVGSGKSAYKKLKQLDNRYRKAGPEGKAISFIILGGHGNSEKTTLGPKVSDHNNDHEITKDTGSVIKRHRTSLQNRVAGNRISENWLNQVFTDNFVLIMNSCSTGAYRGLAESLMKAGRVKRAYAPTYPSSIRNIGLDIEDERLIFKVEYRETQNEIKETIDPTRSIELTDLEK